MELQLALRKMGKELVDPATVLPQVRVPHARCRAHVDHVSRRVREQLHVVDPAEDAAGELRVEVALVHGHDLGARLLARVEAWAAAQGHRYAVLHVAEENGAAIRLYRASGYEPTGQQESLRPGSPIVTIELAKPLATGSDRTTSA